MRAKQSALIIFDGRMITIYLGAADDEEYAGKMAILEQIVKPGVKLIAEQSTLVSHTPANITIQ
ncbi:hypothetical protein FBF86_05400 [Serratia marcescens]|uniref:hypothetical protein n=1 Tax=Serratia marcescens TaxID=615 RepID=UPI00115205A9|nr:hypothetical protein [Serratia marcescens]QDI17445.1 hypothetical protein FBF86_05400 [Serratia marcescens]QDI27188.1 hypothetical protein FG169_05400 [Serratia marcescens]QDI41656.1 hypothetical protein FG172_05400 [Serratia marcescens]QDI56087.1 hypothetical protein FG175_05400 [Serratia marcescens]